MDRLFHSHVQLIYEDEQHKAQCELTGSPTEPSLWWNPKRPDELSLWDSKILLSEAFFNEIISHPVPLDMNTLKALKRCALGLDLYLWLTYRTFTLKSPQRLTWRQLYRQFGTDPAKASDKFIVEQLPPKCSTGVEEDQAGLAGVELRDGQGRLILHPSTPAIAPLDQANYKLVSPLPGPQRPVSGPSASRVGLWSIPPALNRAGAVNRLGFPQVV